jgi:hypothetical protein
MQSRVTDHRIGLTIHGLDDMLAGAQTFLTITDALAEQHLVRSVEGYKCFNNQPPLCRCGIELHVRSCDLAVVLLLCFLQREEIEALEHDFIQEDGL